jgi:hypothetical protein
MITFYLSKSNRKDKKFKVQFINPDSGRWKTINFGQAGASDMSQHGDEHRKNKYLERHQRMGSEDWTNPTSGAGFWSRWIIWNLDTLTKSIKDTEKRFKIRIIQDEKPNEKPSKVLNERPSAYRSMKLSQLGLSKPTTLKNIGKLMDWRNEMWENLTAKLTDGDKFYNCGNKGKNQIQLGLPSVCRPSKRINKSTPQPLSDELTNAQIKKAIKIKQKGQRINWMDL